MSKWLGAAALAASVSFCGGASAQTAFNFKHEEIDKSLAIGYAVCLGDLNGDGKKDIVVCDKTRVIWFENPTWKLRAIMENQARPDNVCIDLADVDGDGNLDVALGAGWRPPNSTSSAPLMWYRRGESLDQPWTGYMIGEEPSLHRIRFADIDKDGKPELVSAPLYAAGSTPGKNWSENGVRLTAYKAPSDATKGPWGYEVLDSSMHTMHNFWPVDMDGDGAIEFLTASFEGVGHVARGKDGKWSRSQLGEGNQANPKGSRGSSEIKLGKLKSGKMYIGTIEPWHGNQVVVYVFGGEAGKPPVRKVIDEQLKWGHAVWCADLDGDGGEELVIGVRDPLNEKVKSGVNVFKSDDGESWTKHVVDSGGMATEDLAVGDLNGDGKPEIVAVGRATKNVKIYWNQR
jgi:hypothetical protein